MRARALIRSLILLLHGICCSAFVCGKVRGVDFGLSSSGFSTGLRKTIGYAQRLPPLFCNQIKFIHKGEVKQDSSRGLLDFVTSNFDGVKRSQAKQWLFYGALLVNNEPQTKHNFPLVPGDVVIVRSGKMKQEPKSSIEFGRLPRSVTLLYEDSDMIVVNKPFGMTTKEKNSNKPTATNKSLLFYLSNYLSRKKTSDKKLEIFLVNNVMEESSGWVVAAKSLSARNYLQTNWSSFGKTYTCIVRGRLNPLQGKLENVMVEIDKKTHCFGNTEEANEKLPKNNGIYHTAISNYRTLETINISEMPFSIIELSLQTDINNQVRTQLEYMNCPIYDDSLHQSHDENELSNRETKSRFYMHASSLKITIPSSREVISINNPITEAFTDSLQILKRRKAAANISTSIDAKVESLRCTDENLSESRDYSGNKIKGISDSSSYSNGVRIVSLNDFLGNNSKPNVSLNKSGSRRSKR